MNGLMNLYLDGLFGSVKVINVHFGASSGLTRQCSKQYLGILILKRIVEIKYRGLE